MSYEPCPLCRDLVEQRFPSDRKCPGAQPTSAAMTGYQPTPVWGPSARQQAQGEILALKLQVIRLRDALALAGVRAAEQELGHGARYWSEAIRAALAPAQKEPPCHCAPEREEPSSRCPRHGSAPAQRGDL